MIEWRRHFATDFAAFNEDELFMFEVWNDKRATGGGGEESS